MRSDTGVIYNNYRFFPELKRFFCCRRRLIVYDGFIKPKLHYSGLITEFSFQSFIFAGASGDGAGLPIINDWRRNSNGKQKNAPRSSYNLCRCSAGLSHRLGNGERTGVRSVFFELGLRRRDDHRGCCKLRGHVLWLTPMPDATERQTLPVCVNSIAERSSARYSLLSHGYLMHAASSL